MIVVRPRRRRLDLYRLAGWCPYCDLRAVERVPASERTRYAGEPPDRIVLFTQCRGRGCRRVYPLHARAYHDATPE